MPKHRLEAVRALAALTIGESLFFSIHRPIAAQQGIDAALYSGLRWRMLGPFRAGRVNAVEGVAARHPSFLRLTR